MITNTIQLYWNKIVQMPIEEVICMLWIIVIEACLVALNLILELISTEKRKLSGLKKLINIAFVMTIVVAGRYYLYSAGAEALFRLLKAEILVSSMNFYATDFVKAVKDRNNSELMRKTLFKALANHIVFTVLFLLVIYFENK